jgi:hypothetical protein
MRRMKRSKQGKLYGMSAIPGDAKNMEIDP